MNLFFVDAPITDSINGNSIFPLRFKSNLFVKYWWQNLIFQSPLVLPSAILIIIWTCEDAAITDSINVNSPVPLRWNVNLCVYLMTKLNFLVVFSFINCHFANYTKPHIRVIGWYLHSWSSIHTGREWETLRRQSKVRVETGNAFITHYSTN